MTANSGSQNVALATKVTTSPVETTWGFMAQPKPQAAAAQMAIATPCSILTRLVLLRTGMARPVRSKC